jgi:hypothetical protein
MDEISGCGKGGWTLVMKVDGKEVNHVGKLHKYLMYRTIENLFRSCPILFKFEILKNYSYLFILKNNMIEKAFRTFNFHDVSSYCKNDRAHARIIPKRLYLNEI